MIPAFVIAAIAVQFGAGLVAVAIAVGIWLGVGVAVAWVIMDDVKRREPTSNWWWLLALLFGLTWPLSGPVGWRTR